MASGIPPVSKTLREVERFGLLVLWDQGGYLSYSPDTTVGIIGTVPVEAPPRRSPQVDPGALRVQKGVFPPGYGPWGMPKGPVIGGFQGG